jgi:ABC-type transporter Mla subunit MlaD
MDKLTTLFCIGIFIIFCWGFRYPVSSQRRENWPNLLTTLGILGTFLGITIGLLDFDVDKIAESIPNLLGGMKTAFITSLCGMVFSLCFKYLTLSELDKKAAKQTQETSPEDISPRHIFEIMFAVSNTSQKTHEALSQFSRNYLDTQGRQEERQNAFKAELFNQLDIFSDKLSKGASAQIIEALQKVISDFNKNLTEQFGENFKQLNAACLKLVEWQDHYKTQLKEMSDVYSQKVTAIEKTESVLDDIARHTKTIPVSLQAWQAIHIEQQDQLKHLNTHLSTFAELRDKAVNALPEIQGHIDKVLNELQVGVERLGNGLDTMADTLNEKAHDIETTLSDGADNIAAHYVGTSQNIESNLSNLSAVFDEKMTEIEANLSINANAIAAHYAETSRKIKSNLAEASESFETSTDNIVDDIEKVEQELRNRIESSIDSIENLLKEQAKTLSSAFDDQIKGSIHKMATELGSIAGHFDKQHQEMKRTHDEINKKRG